MGNKTGNVTSVDFNPKDWQITDRESSQNQNKGDFKVLENVRTGELIDQYQLYWSNEEDFRFYMDSYLWRRQQYNIVPSRFIVEQHTDQFCSRSYGAKVYIEHIPTRLSDVTDIPFPDNLYVVLSVLDGYQKLYQNVHHYFPISEDQICVDREGIVKVWVNSDLSKNYPEPEETNTDNKDEAHMVDDLLNIIWENTDEDSEPQSFRQFFAKRKGKRRIGFDEAKVIVNEYAKTASCQIPQKFNSILQMNEESQDYQGSQHDNENSEKAQGHHYEQEEHQMYENDEHRQYQERGHEEYEHDEQYQPYQSQYGAVVQPQFYSHVERYYPDSHLTYQHPQIVPQYANYLPPVPHALNPPFMPRQVTTVQGPVISIPPMRGGFNVQPMTYHQPIPQQIIYQHPHPAINQVIQQRIPTQIINQDSQIRQQQFFQQSPPQHINEQFTNSHHPFEQRISTLNPQSGSQQQQHNVERRQEYHEEHYEEQSNPRQEINNTVGRSLQLINQSSKKVSETQKLRVNKSHINQVSQGEPVNVNYPKQFDDSSYNNSRITGNSRIGDQFAQYQQKPDQLQGIRQELLDTKYYTLDTEVQLDEEIAADLKKMIMAL